MKEERTDWDQLRNVLISQSCYKYAQHFTTDCVNMQAGEQELIHSAFKTSHGQIYSGGKMPCEPVQLVA